MRLRTPPRLPAPYIVLALLTAAPPAALGAAAGDAGPRMWPVQARPAALVRTGPPHAFPQPRPAYEMLVASVAGLAAASVSERRGDEMVWVATGNPDVEAWYAAVTGGARPAAPIVRGDFAPWDLVDRFAKRGIVKGYILYRADRSPGELNEHRPGMDLSVNVATSLAGILGGVLVEEALEPQARALGLRRLLDARGKTQAWCFQTYRDRFNRRLLCTQDPRKPHARDLAIAQCALTVYGPEAPLADAMAWLEPLSPVLGWNGGDEFETTRLSSLHGHLQTATDWCMNLPVLMAGSDPARSPRVRSFDPHTIDWDDRRSGVCFVGSDGDNVQWLTGNFFSNRDYWANPDRGTIPFGWSACLAQLAELCPPALDRAARTQGANDRFVEWGCGYYYPDLFARSRPDRWALLARHARRMWSLMRQTGTRIIGFNVADLGAPDACKALQVFAGESDGLLAFLVFQYAPYEAGAGNVYWVKDRAGGDVPVIAARYSIWADANNRPRAGTPAKVAREIRDTLAATPPAELPRYDWAVVHAWSYFRKAPGADESAENVPPGAAPPAGAARGYAPATWCAQRLPHDVRPMDPEELAWRLRMRHNPVQARAAIDAYAAGAEERR
jgi:hypothetical protein